MRLSVADPSPAGTSFLRVAVISPHQLVREGVVAILRSAPGLDLVAAARESDPVGQPDVVVYDLLGTPEQVKADDAALAIAPGLCAPTALTLPLAATREELVSAVDAVAARYGGATPEPDSENPGGLSDRQYEAIALVASGLTNAEIAERLFLSVNTVKTNLRYAYRRLGVCSRSQAILWYLEERHRPAEGDRDAGRVLRLASG